MKVKNTILVALFLLSILMIGAVNASENITDNMVNSNVDDNSKTDTNNAVSEINGNEVSVGETNQIDPVSTNVEKNDVGFNNKKLSATPTTEDDKKLSSSKKDNELSADNFENNVLGDPYRPDYKEYSVTIENNKKIHNWKDEAIMIYITPSSSLYAYYFDLKFYNSDNKEFYSQTLSSYTAYTSIRYTIPANSLNPGIYTIKAINFNDKKVMSTAKLIVTNDPYFAVITAEDYTTTYNSGATYSIRVTELGTGSAISGANIRIAFSNGINQYYTSDSNGIVTLTPPLGAGNWDITISSNDIHLDALPILRKATITKSAVSLKAKNVVEYKGFKTTLKATVKSNGKNVNEGTVSFRINGKTYKVAVKKGVATKKIKLKKIKKYTYTAQYNGNANLLKSKKVKRKATLKKRFATKIVAKNQKVNTVQTKFFYVKILTKSGKKVKGGKLKIVGKATPQPVKNGKAKLIKYGTVSMLFKGTNGYIYKYKKSLTKTYTLKYIPASHKYKASTKKVKLTVTYKCPVCGKTKTHYHYRRGYYTWYKTKMVVS